MALFCSFFMVEKCSIVYSMYHIVFMLSSVVAHLGCFHAMPVVNSAAMNTEVQVSSRITVFSLCMSRTGIAGSYGRSVCSFFRNLHTVLHSVGTSFLSHPQCRKVLFPSHPLQHALFVDFLGCNFWEVSLKGGSALPSPTLAALWNVDSTARALAPSWTLKWA